MEPKLSPSKEDYLKVIHLLNDQSIGVRVKDIAGKMDITMPSVSCAMKSLEKQGLVSHSRYDLVDLTPRGTRIAKAIYRRHCIISEFLSNVLEVDTEIADRDACVMEHHISSETLDKFVHFLEEEKGTG
jgi:DtxR family Mn-dependent transcriptional regulator